MQAVFSEKMIVARGWRIVRQWLLFTARRVVVFEWLPHPDISDD